MEHVVSAVLYVWLIINIVPIVMYGVASRVATVEMPKHLSVQQFMLSVFAEKFGVAVAFAFIFLMGEKVTAPNWLYFGLLWWYMGAMSEVATAMRGDYGWPAAITGILSELIYFPLAAYTLAWLISP